MKTEYLSMLSPKSIDLRNPGGGIPALTAQDIAAALSGLHGPPYYLAQIVYVGDCQPFKYLHEDVTRMLRMPKTPSELTRKDPVKGILSLCIDELWGDNRCGACRGAGNTHDQQQCPVCKGRKYKQYTDLSRARQANIPWSYWPLYKGFYERLFMQLTDWDARIRSHLSKRLTDEQFNCMPKVRTPGVKSKNDAPR